MGTNRRFYWLKLKENFFQDKIIKKLRTLENGDTFLIVYLKLLLSTLNTDGYLTHEYIEDNFIDELALTIDEDKDYILKTITYLQSKNLLKKIELNKKYYLTEFSSIVGSETASTQRSRKSRENKKKKDNLEDNFLYHNNKYNDTLI